MLGQLITHHPDHWGGQGNWSGAAPRAGKLAGLAMRVPVPNGSLTDFTCVLNRATTRQEINQAIKTAADGRLKDILEYTEAPILSVDITGNPHSCIFDASLTVASGTLVKVVGWYDNEAGYSAPTADLITRLT